MPTKQEGTDADFRTAEEDIEKFNGRAKVPATLQGGTGTPAAMIHLALSQGQDLDKLEKLLELQIRYEENEAKKAYHEAMAKFKETPPEIEKDRHVKYLKVDYRHASLANVTKKINIALGEYGLSATWQTAQNNGNITITCIITHKLGHSESTSLTAAPDTSGSKNDIQAIGSTVSYLQRYTILALTGLATSDMDDNGKTSEAEYIDEKQHAQIVKLIKSKGVDVTLFLAYMKVKKVEDILASGFKKGMSSLKKAKGKERDPGEEG